MAITIIKGTIRKAQPFRQLPSGKWVQEFVVVEKTKMKEHEHFVQVWSQEKPLADMRELEGEEQECECYVNSHSYLKPNGSTGYATNLTLKFNK